MTTFQIFRRSQTIAALLVSMLLSAQVYAEGASNATQPIKPAASSTAKDAQSLFNKGVAQVEEGQRDEAIKTFTEITEKYPSLPEPYNNLAVLYADQGQYDKARKALETAIKTHPSYATAHENLGDIYARMASEAYDKALQIDNSNSRAQNKLALIKDLFTGATPSSKPTVVAAKTPEAAKPAPIKPAEVKPAEAKPAESKPAAEPAKPTTVANENEAITNAISTWAKAWSAQDVSAYLASYADTFKTPNGESRGAWEAQRKDRVSKPSKISVEVSDMQIKMDDANMASVRFKQTYRADGAPKRTSKTLKMKKVGDRWLINQEIAG